MPVGVQLFDRCWRWRWALIRTLGIDGFERAFLKFFCPADEKKYWPNLLDGQAYTTTYWPFYREGH